MVIVGRYACCGAIVEIDIRVSSQIYFQLLSEITPHITEVSAIFASSFNRLVVYSAGDSNYSNNLFLNIDQVSETSPWTHYK